MLPSLSPLLSSDQNTSFDADLASSKPLASGLVLCSSTNHYKAPHHRHDNHHQPKSRRPIVVSPVIALSTVPSRRQLLSMTTHDHHHHDQNPTRATGPLHADLTVLLWLSPPSPGYSIIKPKRNKKSHKTPFRCRFRCGSTVRRRLLLSLKAHSRTPEPKATISWTPHSTPQSPIDPFQNPFRNPPRPP